LQRSVSECEIYQPDCQIVFRVHENHPFHPLDLVGGFCAGENKKPIGASRRQLAFRNIVIARVIIIINNDLFDTEKVLQELNRQNLKK